MARGKQIKKEFFKKKENKERIETPKHEAEIESAILLLFLVAFLLVKLAQPLGNIIAHSYPFFYLANDNFVNGYVYPQYVKEVGNFRYQPPNIEYGASKVVGYYPLILTHLSAVFSHLSGVETYDTSYLIVNLLLVFGAYLMYFSLKKSDKSLAFIALPFMLGVYNFSFEVAGAFGLWLFLTGASFLLYIIYSTTLLNSKYGFIPMALFFSVAFFGHASEAIFGAAFLGLYSAILYMSDRKIELEIKNLFFGFLGFLILTIYYIIIFRNTWAILQPFKFEIMTKPPFTANPDFAVSITHLDITLLFLIVGLLIFFQTILKKESWENFLEKDKSKGAFIALLSATFLLIMGYSNYIGFGVRAWQTRILWPIYLAPLMALGIYSIAKTILGKWKFEYTVYMTILLFAMFVNAHNNKLQGGGLMNEGIWESFQWISGNTPQDARVLHFYAPYVDQVFSLFSTWRIPYHVRLDDLIDGLQKGIIKDEYTIDSFGDDVDTLKRVESFFSYATPIKEPIEPRKEYMMGDMDYYVFLVDPSKGHPILIQYNSAIKGFFIQKGLATEVFNNGVVSILKNKSPRGEL